MPPNLCKKAVMARKDKKQIPEMNIVLSPSYLPLDLVCSAYSKGVEPTPLGEGRKKTIIAAIPLLRRVAINQAQCFLPCR